MRKPRTKPTLHESGSIDLHAQAIVQGLELMVGIMSNLDAERAVEALEDKIRDAAGRMVDLMAGLHPIVVVEQVRLRALPRHQGQPTYQVGIDNGFSVVEIVSVVASTMYSSPADLAAPPASIVDELVEIAEELRRLGSLRALAAIDSTDPLGWIGATLQITEMSMRSSSYPEMLEVTTRSLSNAQSIDDALRMDAGFGAVDAITLLTQASNRQESRPSCRAFSTAAPRRSAASFR